MEEATLTAPAQAPEEEPAAEPERPAVEVVERPPAAELAVPEQPSALERAAEEMLASPGAPGRDEFLVLATTARLLSMSRGAPKAVRDDPWLAFHMALVGRDLGISPSAAIALIDVIGEGEDAQLSYSPELLNGQVKRLGLGAILPANNTAEGCFAIAVLPGGRIDPRCARSWPEHVESATRPCTCTFDLILGEVEFTWEDAQQAGLVDSACQGPTAHTEACLRGGQGTRGKRCHQGYRTYPKRMMWWRSAAWCQSSYFPEASIGVYTTEELGAVIDPQTGRPYDPATMELPEGYEPPERPHDPGDDLLAEAEDGSELAEARAELRKRIDAVSSAGDGAVAALRELWEKTSEDDGRRMTPPFPHLRRRHLVRVRAIIKSVEDRIKRGQEWGEEAKAAWIDASMASNGFGAGRQEAQEAESGGDAQEAAPAADGAESAQEPAQQAAQVEEAYQAEVEASAEARHARATEMAAAAGLTLPEAEEDAQEPLSDEELMEHAIARAKELAPTDVVAELRRLEVEPLGSLQAQRKLLAELLYNEARAQRDATA